MYSMLGIWIAIGIVCSLVAKSKGKNQYLWFFLGTFFSIIGLLVLLLLPAKKKEKVPDIGHLSDKKMNSDAAAPLGDDSFSDQTPPPAKRIKPDPSMQWHYISETEKLVEVIGPISIDELRKHVINKKLPMSTYIWCEELADWTQIHEFQNMSYLTDADLILDNNEDTKDSSPANSEKKDPLNNSEPKTETEK